MLKAVGMPRSRRDGPAWRMAGWYRGAKQKPMPASATHAATPVGAELDGDAEGLEQVGGAAGRGRRPVAVLAHPPPGTGDDEGGDGADVDRVGPIAAGADHVDHRSAGVDVDAGGRVEHGVDHAAELGDGLALHAQGDDEGGDLGGAGGARRGSPPW